MANIEFNAMSSKSIFFKVKEPETFSDKNIANLLPAAQSY